MDTGFFRRTGWIRVFSPIRIRVYKLMGSNDVLIKFWRSLTKKGSVESVKYEIQICVLLVLQFLDFFSRIRIQIRTKEKKSDSDPEKTGSETLSRTGIILIFLNT